MTDFSLLSQEAYESEHFGEFATRKFCISIDGYQTAIAATGLERDDQILVMGPDNGPFVVLLKDALRRRGALDPDSQVCCVRIEDCLLDDGTGVFARRLLDSKLALEMAHATRNNLPLPETTTLFDKVFQIRSTMRLVRDQDRLFPAAFSAVKAGGKLTTEIPLPRPSRDGDTVFCSADTQSSIRTISSAPPRPDNWTMIFKPQISKQVNLVGPDEVRALDRLIDGVLQPHLEKIMKSERQDMFKKHVDQVTTTISETLKRDGQALRVKDGSNESQNVSRLVYTERARQAYIAKHVEWSGNFATGSRTEFFAPSAPINVTTNLSKIVVVTKK